MSILCLIKDTLTDDLRKQIRNNHKLYSITNNIGISYISSISDLIKDEDEDEDEDDDVSNIIISEYHIFFDMDLNYNNLIKNNDNLLFLPLKNYTIKHVSNIADDTFIIKKSNWSSLILQELGSYSSIIEYIQSKIEISSIDKLQNIDILPSYFRISLHQFISNSSSKVKPLLINMNNISNDIIKDYISNINKHLGIVYVSN